MGQPITSLSSLCRRLNRIRHRQASNDPFRLRRDLGYCDRAAVSLRLGSLQVVCTGRPSMRLDMSASQGQAILVVWGEDGTVLQTNHTEVTHLERQLPAQPVLLHPG